MIQKKVILFVLLLSSLTCSLLSYTKLDKATLRATMYMTSGISYMQASSILKEEGKQETQVRAVFYQKSVVEEIDADILEIYGDARLLTRGMEALAEEDVAGCLISEGLALELFKSIKVQGNQVIAGEKTYTVRGVYKETDKQLIRLNRDEEVAFYQVRIQKQENKTATVTLQEFATRHGLTGTTLQWIEYVGVVKGMLLLAFAMLAILLWYEIVREIIDEIALKMKNTSKRSALQIHDYRKIMKRIYIGIVLVLLFLQVYIPTEMIPSTWSDFTYWESWFQSMSKNIGNVLTLDKIGYEQDFLKQGAYAIVGS